jgi:hypothetical protein
MAFGFLFTFQKWQLQLVSQSSPDPPDLVGSRRIA